MTARIEIPHDEIAALFNGGHTAKAIAARLGLGAWTVYRSLHASRLIPRRRKGQTWAEVEGIRYEPDNDPLPQTVNRDPCVKCGIRADIGCRHNTVRALGWSVGK